jgi:hypothetical protein
MPRSVWKGPFVDQSCEPYTPHDNTRPHADGDDAASLDGNGLTG